MYQTPQNLDPPLFLHHDSVAGNNSFNLSRTSELLILLINTLKGKVNGEVLPITVHEGPEGEQRYSSTLSVTSALDGGGSSKPCPDCFTPGKETHHPWYRSLVGSQGWSGQVQNTSPPSGFDPWTVQPEASRYTD